MTKRGGDFGGGPLVRHVELLTDAAARELRRRATVTGTRYRKDEANITVTELLELLAAQRLMLITPDMRAALPCLTEARQTCQDEAAARGLDQLIAAIWTVEAQR